MRQDDLVIIWSIRLFRMLLILYPGAFRREYGREMTLVFRDTCRQTYSRRGAAGILALWLTTVLDLFSTALVEHLAEASHRSSTVLFSRISGLLATVGGFLLLILVYGEFVLDGIWQPMGYLILMLVYGLGWVALGALLMLGDKRAAYHTGAAA